MDNRRRQFDSIGVRRVVTPARPVIAPPPIREETYNRTSTTQTSRRGGSRIGQFAKQYSTVIVLMIIGLPLIFMGTNYAIKQVSASSLRAVQPDNSDIPSVSVAVAKSPETAADSKKLQSLIDKLVDETSAPVYISVRDLKTGALADHGGDTSITSASLYKLFVANQIYRMVDDGKLSLSKKLPRGKTVAGCLQPMIVVSDNACGAQLGDLLNWGSQDSSLHNQGYNGTTLAGLPHTSSNDVALLFARLYAGKLLSPASNDAFLKLLKAQQINNRLPMGLPDNTVIAHKTGDLYGYMHDAGIIYGGKTDYVVSIMTGEWNYPAQAPAAFADMSEKLWDFFEN